MFTFDQAALPQLTTRKAFIGVDFQNDFLSPTGALPVTEPDGFAERAIQLANAFRSYGDVLWVQSHFDEPRPVTEQIITTDEIAKPRTPARGRPRVSIQVDDDGPPDPEAFLSHDEPTCVEADSEGSRMATVIKDASQETDAVLTKTQYSAFNSTSLLRLLRAKMVMEVFICGSLTNVGVYATALDAAGHGMSITIVEDCCGFRSDTRQSKAIRSLIDLTGCEIASYKEVIESLNPKPKPKAKSRTKTKKPPPAKRVESSRTPVVEAEARPSDDTAEIIQDLSTLRLTADSPTPAADSQPLDTQPQEKASATNVNAAAERLDSQNTPPSKAEEPKSDGTTPEVKANREGDVDDEVVKKDDGEPSKDEKQTPPKQEISTTTALNKAFKQFTLKEDSIEPTATSTATEPPSSPPKEDQQIMDKSTPQIEAEEGRLLQKGLCEGDTDIIENVLPAALEDGIFDKLREEVQWQRMSHQGGEVPRLVAVQGQIADDGSMPVYRHPSDESPPLLAFTPTVLAIKAETEKHLGHPLNHVLIQYYRDGLDYISEHSDKTLDIVEGSFIANVSLGAERTMVFRTKRLDKDHTRTGPVPTDTKRQIQRARLPHNSLCRMGLKTNMKWLHAIRQDKRAERDKTPAELAYKGGRISLTFRQIGTFLNKEETLTWGQGATGKTREEAKAVINGQTDEAVAMLRAFGTENHASEFDWKAFYGKGFDVLHMSNAPRLFASPDPIVNNRIALMLAECGVNYAKGSMGPAPNTASKSSDVPVRFVDNDADKATVQGDMAIMLYLDARYGAGSAETPRTPAELAKQFTRFQQGLNLLDKYRALEEDEAGKRDVKGLKGELATWNAYAAEAEEGFLAGEKPTLVDFAVWPVLHAMVEEGGVEAVFEGFDGLKKYYGRVLARDSAKKILNK